MTSPLGSLAEQLAGHVAGPAEPGPTARDAVNQPMIRHWCDAMGDANPVYLDDAAARAAGHPGVVAPPTMLQAWTMRGFVTTPAQPTAAATVLAALDDAGFTSVVATDCVQTYDRYLVLGDLLSERVTVESISAEKRTALGVGHFVTTRRDYLDQRGDRVATMQFRVLKFRPGARSTSIAARPAPVTTADTEFFFDAFADGRLSAQRCTGCGTLRHPPAPTCAGCGDAGFTVVELSGRGSVYSYVVVHHPQQPGFTYPLVVALVELEEGPRIVSDLDGIEPGDVRIGQAVTLHRRDEPDSLPCFRPDEVG